MVAISDGSVRPSGNLMASDHMVEAIVRRHVTRHRTTFRVDHDMVGLDANLAQHRAHKRGFVFAVSVAVREHVGRRMGLQAPECPTQSPHSGCRVARKSAIACIFCKRAGFEAVSVTTCCLISGDASTRPPIRFTYHFPIAPSRLIHSELGPPEVKNDKSSGPPRRRSGGIRGSCSDPFHIANASTATNCCPPGLGLTSGWLSQEALYSHPGGSWRE